MSRYRFYHGLPSVIDLLAKRADIDDLDVSDACLLASCAETAAVSLGVLNEAFARLVMANQSAGKSNQVEAETVHEALTELTLLNAGLLPLLAEISSQSTSVYTGKAQAELTESGKGGKS